MRVVPVPVRSDNYAYLLIDSSSKKTLVVDPYDVSKVQEALDKEGISDKSLIKGIITTHHHDDHAGGNIEFAAKYPGVTVYGGSQQVAGLTHKVEDKETFKFGDIDISCLATPCHTQDSICFHVKDSKTGEQGVFTGDTLFIAGCGRFFEGTPEEMHQSLSYLGTLPDETIVYNGHEYTKGNVAFALSIDKENPAIQRLDDFSQKNKITTAISTIGDEKQWNVFMRLDSEPVRKATQSESIIGAMEKLRELKNSFRG